MRGDTCRSDLATLSTDELTACLKSKVSRGWKRREIGHFDLIRNLAFGARNRTLRTVRPLLSRLPAAVPHGFAGFSRFSGLRELVCLGSPGERNIVSYRVSKIYRRRYFGWYVLLCAALRNLWRSSVPSMGRINFFENINRAPRRSARLWPTCAPRANRSTYDPTTMQCVSQM